MSHAMQEWCPVAIGDALNENTAYRIGRADAVYLQPKSVVIGGDIRHRSNPLKLALAKGLMDEGVDVIDHRYGRYCQWLREAGEL